MINIKSESSLSEEQVERAITAKIHFLYGVKGADELNYRLIDYYPDEQNLIIRCNHDRLNEIRAVIAHISEINGNKVRMDVNLVSGTIKTLKRKAGV